MKSIKASIKKYLNLLIPEKFYRALPIYSIKEVKQNEDKIFNYDQKTFPGINLNIESQIDLIKSFNAYKNERPWDINPKKGLRAFLQYNSGFDIILFNSYLEYHYKDLNYPLIRKAAGEVSG